MILLYLAVVAAYLAATWLEWRQLAQAPEHASPATAIAQWLPALALAGHAVLVSSVVFAGGRVDLSLANALSAVAGLIALFAWLGSRAGALPGVAVIALPVAAVAVLLPLLFANPHPMSISDEPWAALHIAVALTGYAMLIVAGAAGLAADRRRAATASRRGRARRRGDAAAVDARALPVPAGQRRLCAADADAAERDLLFRGIVRQAADLHAQDRVLGARLAGVRGGSGRTLPLRLARKTRAAAGSSPAACCCCSPTSAASSCSRRSCTAEAPSP